MLTAGNGQVIKNQLIEKIDRKDQKSSYWSLGQNFNSIIANLNTVLRGPGNARG